jgi:HEAT repeat protein
MKFFMALLLLAGGAGMLWQNYKPVAAPPPPPPPPAILSQPLPVIDQAEQAKVLKSAEDPDPNVRWEAVILLDKMNSPEALPLMFHMLEKDLDVDLRVKIIDRLSNRKEQQVTAAVVRSMKDMEAEVRLAALRALDKIGDYAVASAIMAGPVKDQDEKVRLQALRVLNSLQDKRQAEIDEARRKYEEEKRRAEEAAKNK